MNDVANAIANGYSVKTWWIYIFIHKILIILFKSLITLSASNDVNMHFQGHFEEP